MNRRESIPAAPCSTFCTRRPFSAGAQLCVWWKGRREVHLASSADIDAKGAGWSWWRSGRWAFRVFKPFLHRLSFWFILIMYLMYRRYCRLSSYISVPGCGKWVNEHLYLHRWWRERERQKQRERKHIHTYMHHGYVCVYNRIRTQDWNFLRLQYWSIL